MAFKVGQKVCCIKTDAWQYISAEVGPGPKHGDIVEIIEISEPDGFLSFAEWDADDEYDPKYFRPLQETGMSILKAILANPHKQLETVE